MMTSEHSPGAVFSAMSADHAGAFREQMTGMGVFMEGLRLVVTPSGRRFAGGLAHAIAVPSGGPCGSPRAHRQFGRPHRFHSDWRPP